MVVSDELRSLSAEESVRSGVVDPESVVSVERGDGCGLLREPVDVGGTSVRDGARSMKRAGSESKGGGTKRRNGGTRKNGVRREEKRDEGRIKNAFWAETLPQLSGQRAGRCAPVTPPSRPKGASKA